MQVDVTSTVETLNDIAQKLSDYSNDVRREAQNLKETGDLLIAGEVVNLLMNMQNNLGIDLLARRPVREYQIMLLKQERAADQ